MGVACLCILTPDEMQHSSTTCSLSAELSSASRTSSYRELYVHLIDGVLYLHCLSFKPPKQLPPTTSAHTGSRPGEETRTSSSHWIWTQKQTNKKFRCIKEPPHFFFLRLLLASLFCWSPSFMFPKECMLETEGIMG